MVWRAVCARHLEEKARLVKEDLRRMFLMMWAEKASSRAEHRVRTPGVLVSRTAAWTARRFERADDPAEGPFCKRRREVGR